KASINSNTPIQNGLPQKEDEVGEEDEQAESVRAVAAKVVDNVVKLASEAAQEASYGNSSSSSPLKKSRGCGLQRLPTIQIDTVPSPPPSPTDDLSQPNSIEADEPIDTSQIEFDLEADQEAGPSSEELKDFLKDYVEDILSRAMVVAEKKLQFAGIDDEEEEEEGEETDGAGPEASISKAENDEPNDSEIRAAAEKVVEEVISKATETVAEQMEKDTSSLTFPGLPSIQIDTVKSAPPSPESEEELPQPQKKWTFTMRDDEPEKTEEEDTAEVPETKASMITFDEAPEDVKELASNVVKEVVSKAVAMAEEKNVPVLPVNFEEVEHIKTTGPWYIRFRETLVRVLRTACFCAPRRNDS
ncbi:FK506-binding protein 5-like, partial [Stegodyphus dumicola]|uniref:FK506-binding protein 5-like n=1 Tax=Stegodyphus dumicola TaxID=202533 RepID=UPI0015B11414